MRWENLREEEFAGAIERSKGVCVIPIGCMEKHGQHLPVGTDSIVAEGIVNMAAELEEVVVFPATYWLGVAIQMHPDTEPEKRRKRGYVAINPQTMLTVLEELCDEIARNGFRKVLLVNTHGGNRGFLNYFTHAQGYKQKNYATLLIESVGGLKLNGQGCTIHDIYQMVSADRSKYPMLTDADMEVLARFNETGLGGGHAGLMETAYMMYLRPETVAPDRFEAESGSSTHRADHLSRAGVQSQMVFWDSNFPNAYNGFAPVGCSEAIGQVFAKIRAQRLAQAFKVVKEDEDSVRMTLKLPKED